MTEQIYIWSDSHSVGHPLLDAQHQRLLGLCRQVEEATYLRGPEALSITHILLTALVQCSQEHFTTEYRVLHDVGYPHLQDEVAEHVEFQNTLSNILSQIRRGRTDDAAIRSFLSSWMLEHLFQRDMKYKPFLAHEAERPALHMPVAVVDADADALQPECTPAAAVA